VGEGMKNDALSESQMRELILDRFAYDHITGSLTYGKDFRSNGVSLPAGRIAGAIVDTGYYKVYIRGRKFLVHRLIWLYVYGNWPNQIDHINGDRADNRLCNLRESDYSRNAMNQRRPQKQNTTGYLGVSRTGGRKKPFRANIFFDGKNRYLGTFYTAEEAHQAYINAKRIHHETCSI
jgi:hypothetical protein